MTAQLSFAQHDFSEADASLMYVTMRVDKQLFGIPVTYIRDVLRQQHITAIPLASKEVAGSLNLRGRIVTVINVRNRLKLEDRTADNKNMFVVVEHKDDLYSLMVDSVGEVLTITSTSIEKVPSNLGGSWRDVASGIYKLSGELLVIIDVKAMLTL
jgi:purine-binding chemotaxis protein CheW